MSRGRLLTFIGWGVTLWAVFLLLIRLIGPAVFSTRNPWLLAAFVVTVPLTWVLIRGLAALTGTPPDAMLVPVAVMDCTALFLDGLAVGFTSFYGPTADQVRAAAAYLLWGVAVTLAVSLWLANPRG